MEKYTESKILTNKAYYENCSEYELYCKINEIGSYITRTENEFASSSEKPNLELEYAEISFLTKLTAKYTNLISNTGIPYICEEKFEHWFNYWNYYTRNYIDLATEIEIQKRISCNEDFSEFMPTANFQTMIAAILMEAPIQNHIGGEFNKDIIELYLYLFNTLNSYEAGFVTSPLRTNYDESGVDIVSYTKNSANYLRLLSKMASLYLNDKSSLFVKGRIEELPNFEEVRNYAYLAYIDLNGKVLK